MLITYYSRPHCSLCEEGLATLKMVQEELHFEIEVINIEEDDQLLEKYMLCIPVVEKEGTIIQKGVIDYVNLYEKLKSIDF